jgi:signal transduction histidine kinase/CheY-like chemotaxis protein
METPEPISNPSFSKEELRVSLAPVLAFLALLAAGLVLLTGDMNAFFQSNGLLLMRILLYLLIFLSWAANRWKPYFGKTILVIGSAAYLCGFAILNNLPDLFILLFIPVGLAAAMLSLRAGAFLAVILSAFFAAYSWSAPLAFPQLQALFALVAIWAMAGMMAAVYHPVFQFGDWSWNYYQRALENMREAARYRIELNQALEELLHTNRQLALANEKQLSFRILAEEAEKTKTAFVAKVSHEFRTPLNMIIGLVNLMIEDPQIYGRSLPKAMLDDLLIIQRNCEHLTGMINDVLALSQAESGRLTLHREYVDLREIIVQAFEVVSPLVKKKGLQTDYALPEPLPPVYCDRTRIRQVLLNLVSNAARFTEQGGISIQVEDQPGELLISVIDTGPGIPQDDLERIFDPFCQSNNGQTWRDKGGTGLGLTISKQFIELHGGKIWVESQPGHGASFFFNLPKDQPVGPMATPRRWISDRWTWIARDGKPRFSAEILQRPRIALYDPQHVLAEVLAIYKDQLEFSVCEEISQLIDDVKQTPANLVLVNARTQDELSTAIETIRSAIQDTPLVGCMLPRPAWEGLSKSVAQILVKPITKSQLNQAVEDLHRPIHKILLIDNDTEITNLYSRMLEVERPGVQVSVAASGLAALQQMKADRPDLVLLDISMPEMNGFAVLAEKDRDPAISSIPVMIVSATDLLSSSLQTRLIVATMANGVAPAKLVDCAVGLSELLLRPGSRLDPAPG